MRCLRFLCKMCGGRALLPRPLIIAASYGQTEVPVGRGGFADVWKGRLGDRDVAVKVLRTYLTSDHRQIKKVRL